LLIAILYKYRLLLVKILSFAVVVIGLVLTIMLLMFASTNPPHLSFVVFTNLPSLNFVVPTPATLLNQAQAMLQQFYDDINKKDYCGAYNLWIISSPNPPTCQDFAQGYQNTVHVDILFDKNQSTLLDDDKVFVTINVNNRENNAINKATYHGWYIVKRQNGTWKIQGGTLCPISQTTCTA
jgi:hypothetical protein